MKTTRGRRWLALLLTLAMCLTLAPAAFADDPEYPEYDVVKAADKVTIEIEPGELCLTVGKTSVLTATVKVNGEKITPAEGSVEWTIEGDTGVISVDPVDPVNPGIGKVEALKAGGATAIATYTYRRAAAQVADEDQEDLEDQEDPEGQEGQEPETVLAKCKVTVPAITGVRSVTLDKPSLFILKDGSTTETLTATAFPLWSDGADRKADDNWDVTYFWESDNKTVAVVSSAGVITAKGEGAATITVTASYGGEKKTAACKVTVEEKMKEVALSPNGSITLEQGSSSQQITAVTSPADRTVTWHSSDESVATVSRGVIYARSPGEATITASISGTGDNKASGTVTVEVSGIKLEPSSSMSIQENQSEELPQAYRFGVARGKAVTWMSMDPDVAEVANGRVVGIGPGRTTVRASVSGGIYEASFVVNVDADPNSTIDRTSQVLRITDTLKFSDLASAFRRQAGNDLSHVTGLRLDTAQGTLYYKYYSEAEPGAGVAQQNSYYLNPKSGQLGLSDITFVPKSTFAGGQVTIYYTAISSSYQNYSCRILLSVEPKSGVSSLALSTPYDTPLRLSSEEFDRVCQELSGVGVNTVTFSQPSSRQGALYTDYASPDNYGSMVSTSRAYTRQELDDIWFVPAAGFSGEVTIPYTARGHGSAGGVYTGSLTIRVGERSAVNEGGPVYNTAAGGPVTFDDRDFEDYREKALSNGDTLSYVQFDSLPSASQGVLYYDYRSASSPGSRVSEGSSYYYGTRTPRLDRITFVPLEGFTGTVRVPFTGWDRDGRRFSGVVEIAVRGSSGKGDIRYTCAPGKTVSFKSADFTGLSRELTGRTLSSIRIQSLPGSSDGYLYYNNSRITGTTSTYSSSNISKLSFRAGSGFSGSVDIPFVGYSTGSDTFYGTVTVSSSGLTDWTVRYTTRASSAAVFKRSDFDDLSVWETDNGINYIRFDVPSTSEGSLYRSYTSSSSKGTRIKSSTTSIYAGDLNQVAFIPNRNFDGTVYLDFTARSLSGDTFLGTVEITVNGASAGDLTVSYTTKASSAAVFKRTDFDELSDWETDRKINYVRFEIPSTSEGDLYRGYTSSSSKGTRISSSTTSIYGSDLNRVAFIPKRSFSGTVYVDFTARSLSGDTFQGTVEITVEGASASDSDLTVSYATKANSAAVFKRTDFDELSDWETDRKINYVRFEIPGAAQGDLYRGYTSSSSKGTRISSSTTSIYASDLNRVAFVPNRSFSGTAYLDFTARSLSGDTFQGTVEITVEGVSASDLTIRYTAKTNSAALLQRTDFDDLSQQETNRKINYVRFEIPGTAQGDLYRGYTSSSSKGTRISSSTTSIYGSDLDRVAFIPNKSFLGTAYVDFTARSLSGDTFYGTLEITVEDGSAPKPVSFTDVAPGTYYAEAVRWAVNNGITTGTSGTTFSPDWTCTVAEILTFLYRANGSPQVTASNPFTDVRASDYYYEAALWAYQKGLVSGSTLNPLAPCTRGMVVTYLWRLAGRPTPAAQPVGYEPCTLSGSQEYGSFTIRFEAAAAAERKITLHYDNDLIDHIDRDFEPAETYDVTLIAVRPGSGYTIDGGFYGYTYASDDPEWFNAVPASLYFRAGDGTFRYTLTQTGHDSSEFALFGSSLSWFRENGRQESITGNNGSADCGALIQLDGAYYFVTYADSAAAAGLLSGTAGFADVPVGASFEQAVAWALEKKVTSGTGKTTFSPEAVCTRGQIVTFLYRAMGQ